MKQTTPQRGRSPQPNAEEHTKPKEKIFVVREANTLLPFLLDAMNHCSRSHVKSLLAHRQVRVNNSVSTKFDASLKPGFEVRISLTGAKEEFNHSMLRIVYEDRHLIVVEKKEGLLSIANDKTRDKTAYFILSEYVKKKHHTNKIFIVHRLDRETSGLMVYAKSEEVQSIMQYNWKQIVQERKYVSVMEGVLPQASGTISSYLSENKNFKVFAAPQGEGLIAHTHFRVLRANDDYSLVELQLETGRKNQIRAHAEFIGHSIAGDKKYGAKGSPIRRVALHAHKLIFNHPITGDLLRFETNVPKAFLSLVK